VVLLMDADADGIHCGALMCLFFHRMMRPLLDGGHVWMAQPPVATLTATGLVQSRHVYSDAEYRAVCAELRASGVTDLNTVRYRGVAGLDHETLASTCVHPDTRALRPLNHGDAEAALAVFGGDRPDVGV
jgi:DNA gyrase subunit B